MALTQPGPDTPPPQWTGNGAGQSMRGQLAVTSCMETLQVGYLHAVAAAAGCALASPFPDNGIDWHVTHGSTTRAGRP